MAAMRAQIVCELCNALAVAVLGDEDHAARRHVGRRYQIKSVSIDMSPAFIKGVDEHLPLARVTFDKFHVVAHASDAVDKMRRIEQKSDPSLKGLRWALLKDRDKLRAQQREDLDALVTQYTSKRTARCDAGPVQARQKENPGVRY